MRRYSLPAGEQHPLSKLHDDDVRTIRALFADGASAESLAEMFDVSTNTIYSIARRETWGHVK